MMLKDVPTGVLANMYLKWRIISRRGFNKDTDWSRCSMCEYVCESKEGADADDSCLECPLQEDGWCNSRTTSRLYNADTETAEEFMEYLRKELNRRMLDEFIAFSESVWEGRGNVRRVRGERKW